ncbi:hypothetical protein [Salinicola tamaricis]|uniref:hypothetical protein n=1 Tax=Salinicola tamaricis TaxID=1771309 RepID=UPI000D0A3587|nr:hypothetical protein [Salinicola tamaricis]
MSLGTALTVSSLALASVLAREWTQRRLAPLSGGRPWGAWVGFAGGAVILALGLSLTLAQWQQGPAPGAPFLGTPGRPRARRCCRGHIALPERVFTNSASEGQTGARS